MKITDTIRYAGVNDHQIDLFEGQYKVPNGMSYNSYVILDDKIAVMDTVDANFTHEWLDNIQQILDGRTPDYLIVQHMEPDHASSALALLEKYPDAKIIGQPQTFKLFEQFFRLDSSRATRTGGAGLGLAIAKEIVELHGGTIRADSTEDRITFTICLPSDHSEAP